MAKIAKPDIAPINRTYGELCEDLHFTGYAFERGCQRLRKLLSDDSWRQCGGGFANVDDFLNSLGLDAFAKITEERREIKKLIQELRPEVSTRAIARALKVDEGTLRKTSAPKAKTAKQNNDGLRNVSAPALAGAAVAKLAARRENTVDRRDERLAKIAEISKGNTALGTSTRYPIIYADPPWRYENPAISSEDRRVENHYPTMTLEEICALPVAQLASDDALLYLWATAPKLAEAISVVIPSWGFDYRTCCVWDKEIIGTGYHFRNQHELLLVARRGDIPPPSLGAQPPSVYRERRTGHSVKPIFYYEMIERSYPQLPKIELFSRGVGRPGWATWGNQATQAVAAE